MSRKVKMLEILEKYISIRKNIYSALQERNSSSLDSLNSQKHELVSKLFSFLSDREYGFFKDKIQQLISGISKNCQLEDMKNYISYGEQGKYFGCLEEQKKSIAKFIEENLVKSVTLVETEDGVMMCNGEFYHGVCHD